MFNLKRVRAGEYVTTDGKYTIEKDGSFWCAYDSSTGQSVVDSECTFRQIKSSLEGKYEHGKR